MLPRVSPTLLLLADRNVLAVCGQVCRWASRNARVWMGQRRTPQGPELGVNDPFIEDPEEIPQVEDTIRTVMREAKRREMAMKFHRIRKEMGSPGPPPRKLSWDAMEQIRYLKQEFPEEWTVSRLAEGFSVSTDVIHRVLRSKFIPSPERRAKQDSKVQAEVLRKSLPARGRAGQDKLQLPERPAAILPAGAGSALVTLDHLSQSTGQAVAKTAPSSGAMSTDSVTSVPTTHSTVWSSATSQVVETKGQSLLSQTEEEELEEGEEDSWEWDGWVLSDEELEELAGTHPDQNYQVIQKGTEFYDGAGNFLYRI
ncbi:hypothetical protein GJAV_G00191920 [Gymnothorax javanicus]|nr:hypothetical protein GJAV_G00191920 [Gymnothorax javanicus]